MTKLVGSCHICGAPAMNTCRFCGRLVCRGCYEPEHGACVSCRGKHGDKNQKDKKETWVRTDKTGKVYM